MDPQYLLSKQQVKDAYERIQTSDMVKPPYYEMNLSGTNLSLAIGASLFEDIPDQGSIVSIDGDDLLRVAYEVDRSTGAVFPSFSGRFFDRRGALLLQIQGNEITFSDSSHDIENQGPTISVFTGNKEFGVEFSIVPPARIELQRLHMVYKGVELLFDGNFAARVPSSSESFLEFGMPGIYAQGARSAVHYSSAAADRHPEGALKMQGGVGVTVPGTGLTFARGAGAMRIKELYAHTRKR